MPTISVRTITDTKFEISSFEDIYPALKLYAGICGWEVVEGAFPRTDISIFRTPKGDDFLVSWNSKYADGPQRVREVVEAMAVQRGVTPPEMMRAILNIQESPWRSLVTDPPTKEWLIQLRGPLPSDPNAETGAHFGCSGNIYRYVRITRVWDADRLNPLIAKGFTHWLEVPDAGPGV